MAKNDYLASQEADRQRFFDVGEEMGIQKAWDYMQLVLIDPEVMSTHVLTKERLQKVYKKMAELADHYKTAFSDHKEADYYQTELDGCLREIWGEELCEFPDRYPYIKMHKYNKGKDKWR